MILPLPLLHIGESLCYDLTWYRIVNEDTARTGIAD